MPLPQKIRQFLNRQRELRSSRLLLNQVRGKTHNKDVAFVFSSRRQLSSPYRHGFHAKAYALIAFELSKRGYPCYFLFDDPVLNNFFPVLEHDGNRLSNSIVESVPRIDYFSRETDGTAPYPAIEIDDSEIRIHGIDFSPVIRCTLRTIQKRYNINKNDTEIIQLTKNMAQSCYILSEIFRNINSFATENNVRINLCGWESNYIPNGVFHYLSHNIPNSNVHYFDLNRSYIHYFGQHPRGANFICVANLTEKKIVDRKVVTREELETIHLEENQLSQYTSSIEKALNKHADLEPTSEKNEILSLIQSYRSMGKQIFVLHGHLFFDVGLDDTSPSFHDMGEWISDTIRFFRNREDLLLLKPHPVETVKGPRETMAAYAGSLLNNEKNIRVLDPLSFNVPELAKWMTCGIIWRSSVALELTYLRIPTIVAGRPRYNAVSLNYPRNKSDYFRMIRHASSLGVRDSQVHDVIRYLYFLEKHKSFQLRELCINGSWDRRNLMDYLRHGDEKLDLFVDHLLTETRPLT